MKRLVIIILGLMLSSCSVGYYANNGMGVITTANLSLQPAWGPAGYDCAHYYYFPDYNFYYDVDNALFYYLSGSRWISTQRLPYTLGYPKDLYMLYKVVLNIRDPWNHNRVHRREYKHFRGIHTQPVLRDRPHNRPPQMQRPQNRPSNNSYRPQPNNNRQPQAQPQRPQNGNMRPQNNGYVPDNRNTIRNSRNNNTSRNNVAPQSTPSRNNTGVQKPQNTKPKQSPQATSGSRNNQSSASGSRGNVKQSQPKQSQSSGTTRSSNDKSSSSSGSRSTGSRGR